MDFSLIAGVCKGMGFYGVRTASCRCSNGFLIEGANAPFFLCVFARDFDLGLHLRLLFGVTFFASLGLHLGLHF